MTINHNDAPQGFVALQANPQYECRGCYFEKRHACPRRENNELFCLAEERSDGMSVILEKVRS